MIKISRRHWKINCIKKLSDLTENPTLFWSRLKYLRGAIKSSTSNVVSPQQWLEHFQNCVILKIKRKMTKNILMMLVEIYETLFRTLCLQVKKSLKVLHFRNQRKKVVTILSVMK